MGCSQPLLRVPPELVQPWAGKEGRDELFLGDWAQATVKAGGFGREEGTSCLSALSSLSG